MQAKSTKLRILKILGKSILALLVVLAGLILILHIPFIQRYITQQLPGYLSERIGAKVEIQKIAFSLLGCAEIQGLKVWDPGDELILSLDTLDLEADFFDFLKGDFRVHKLKLTQVYSRVTQDQSEAFNFQFIVDAFVSTGNPDTSSSSFRLRCDTLILKDFDFAFQSMGDEMMLSSSLDNFFGTDILVASNPLMIYADSIFVNRHELAVISKTIDGMVAEEPYDKEVNGFNFDVNLGLGIKLRALTLSENIFSYHKDTILQTPKFDPDHVIVDQVDLEAKDILLNQGALHVNMQALMAQMPGFELTKGSAEIELNARRLSVSKLVLNTKHSHLNGEGEIENSPDGDLSPNIALASKGQMALEDFSYFLADSIEEIMGQWPVTSFVFELSPMGAGKQNIVLDLSTANSQLGVAGALENILDIEKLAWRDLNIQSRIGTDLRSLLSNFIGEANLPPDRIVVSMNSSGNRSKIGLDGRIETTWGDVEVQGDFGPTSSGLDMDMHLASTNLMLRDYLKAPWLGPADLSISVHGSLGTHQNLFLDGIVSGIEFSNSAIHQIQLESHLWKDSLTASVMISDPDYKGRINLNGELGSPTMKFAGLIHLDSFKLGQLIAADSSLIVSGDFKADVALGETSIEAKLEGMDFAAIDKRNNYFLDSLEGSVFLSTDTSYLSYQASDGNIDLSANFDLRESEQVLNVLSGQIMHSIDSTFSKSGSRAFTIAAHLDDPGILLLAGIPIDSFSSMQLNGAWDEQAQFLELTANTGLISAVGVSLDTLEFNMNMSGTKINSTLGAKTLFYKTLELGDMSFDIVTKTDTSESHLDISHDSIHLLTLDTRFLINENSISVIPQEFVFYNYEYNFNSSSPLLFVKDNVVIDGLTLAREDMKISLVGDMNAFNLEFNNLHLNKLDPIFFNDSTVIDSGRLNGKLSYIRNQQLNLVAHADNLILLESEPLTIDVKAETKDRIVPFEIEVSNGQSNISVVGDYEFSRNEVAADVLMDIKDLREFRVFYQQMLDDLEGSVTGEAKISGALGNPDFSGYLQFGEVDFSLKNPKLSFAVKNDRVAFDNHGVVFTDFVIYDNLGNPLQISGAIQNKEYTSYAYDLNIKTDHYALINRPDNASEHLNGLLVLGTDIQLTGNEKDTYLKADILIKDTTKLMLTLPDTKNELLNTDGIIEFVDAAHLLDSTHQAQQGTAYDSLIASLPDFSLTSKITIEEEAGLTIHIDPASGDYFQVAGKASLDLMYDRTGNPMLNGTYEVADGVYSLSFYDLVKKDFKLVKGSSIKWSGGPEDGVLDIKAAYSIQSNSIGLVGNEVSESEKSVYKKSLNYEIGINISGTIMQPEISFSLDLPEEDKITYPTLANKLIRLKQPEFQSELNKQVFGLLVLGSFLPETSEADGGQSDIATTALYNSVNSVLAAQLNKLAGQYIKGVNIDVGIQSYSDYTSSGGKTKTSMDFRVSKSLLDDRLVLEVGGDFDIGEDQSGANQGKSYRTDVAIIYDLTGNGDKKLKLFNNESYDIIYQEIRNTGISLIFIKEFNKGELKKRKDK